jgi:aryl-alcohol dehydrogenase-like predicted oxidoreductase
MAPSHKNPPAFTRAAFLKGAAKAAAVVAAALLIKTRPAFAADAAPLAVRTVPKSFEGYVKLPVIGLGTRSMSRTDTKAVAGQAQVINALLDGGGKVIDTAANYTGGDSEEVIGSALAALGKRGMAFIASKYAEQTKEGGEKSIRNSLEVLRTNVVDLMFIHNMVAIEAQLPVLEAAKGRTVRYIGISDTSDRQDELEKYLDRLDFIEFAYAADMRAAEKRLLPAAKDKGVAVLVALPLGRGRALQAVKGKQVPEWAKKELGVETHAQLLLKFVIGHPAVTVAIPSTLDPKHMAENLAAGRGPIPDEKQRAKIAAIWEGA